MIIYFNLYFVWGTSVKNCSSRPVFLNNTSSIVIVFLLSSYMVIKRYVLTVI